MGFYWSSTRTNLFPDQWPIDVSLVTWFDVKPIFCQCGFGFELTTKTGVGEAVGRQRSGQSRFFTRRTKSVGCIGLIIGFDWTCHRVDKLDAIPSNRMITTTDASLRSEGFHFTVHSLRSFHWSSSLLFFKCHRVNKSGEPIRYKSMAPHFRVWSNPERDRRFSPTHNWSTVKKVDCSQVCSCFKS